MPGRRPHSCRLKIVRKRLAGALVRDNIVGDLLAFVEVPHPGALDGADVNEHVGPAVRRLDETEAFCSVEPFHCPVAIAILLRVVTLARPASAREGSRQLQNL